MTATSFAAPLTAGLLIGDHELSTTALDPMEHINPSTGDVLGTITVAGDAEVDEAVASARTALRTWGTTPGSERRTVLQRLAALLREHAAEFAALSTAESGIIAPVAATLAPGAAEYFEYFAGWADKLEGAVHPASGAFNYSQPEPYGVVALLLTWNCPASTIGVTVAPALAAGCTIVLKPAEQAPFTTALFGRLCREAGLPAGVLNIVNGGPATGDRLVRHPGIDKISFIGGRETARLIQAAAAESITPLILELGGKSANIVFADADLDYAADCAVAGLLALNGQTCIAPTRLLAHASIYEPLLDRIVKRVDNATIGDPTDANTQVGPVIGRRTVDRIAQVVSDAGSDGAELRSSTAEIGGVPAAGCYVRPVVLGSVDSHSRVAQQEIFGPVLSAMKFSDDDEAVAMANDVDFGLAAYVHTSDVTRALTIANRLDAANIGINGPSPVGPTSPFGGFKDSGYGKQGGEAGIREFLRTKSVIVHTTRPF